MAHQFPRMGLMKTAVAYHLTWNNCKSIMTLLNWPPGKQDSIKSAQDLLDELEAQCIIAENNFQRLVEILETLSLFQASLVVKTYTPQVHASTHPSFPSQMPPAFQDGGAFLQSPMSLAPGLLYQQPLQPAGPNRSEKPAGERQGLGNMLAKQHTPQMQPHYSMINNREKLEQLHITRNESVEPQMFQSMHGGQPPDADSMQPMAQTQQQQHSKEGVSAKDIETWQLYKEKFYNKPFLDETAHSHHFVPRELNFVLIGKTGSGKSATGNTLVGRQFFDEGDGASSQTKTISLCNVREEDRHITVIDTPGLFDTKGDFTNEAIILEMVKTMIAFCNGIHLFLLVFKADMKFTDEEKKTVLAIEKILSTRIYEHCVIVLTRAATQFGGKKKTKSLTKYITAEKQRDEGFAHLIAKVCDRVVAVENDFIEDAIAGLHRQTFLRYLMTVVNNKRGQCFSNKLFVEIDMRRKQDELERQKRIQKAAQLSQMEYRVEKFLYENFLEGLLAEDLNRLPIVFEHFVDYIQMYANVTHLNFVDRDDVMKFLNKFAKEKEGYIQRLSQMKLKERALQRQKKATDEINARKVGAKLPSFLKLEPENRLTEFTVCLQRKDLSRVQDLLSNYAQILSKSKDVSSDMGDIEVLLQTYCLTNADIVNDNIQQILKTRSEMKRIEYKKEQDEKRNKVFAKISAIIDKDLETYLTNKTKKQLNEIKKQMDQYQVPTDILQGVKSALPEEEVAELDDNIIGREIVRQLWTKKTRIDEFVKKSEDCFPGSVLVQTKTNGSKHISAVKVNDEILVFDDDGHLFYQKVYIISHANATKEALYVQIATKEGKMLFISPHHILPIGALCKNIPAKDVAMGDTIFTMNHGVLRPDIVTSVSYKICKGAFCPMTMNGNIVVNDVAASCYTTLVNPFLAHILLSPFRIMFKYFPTPVFNRILPYDSVEGMPLILAVSRAAIIFIRSALNHLKLL